MNSPVRPGAPRLHRDRGQVRTRAVSPTSGPVALPTAERAAPPAALGRAATASALWLLAQKWVVRVSGLATIALLTRLLGPTAFGLVAAANAVVPFVLLLSDFGLSTYLVQADTADRRTVSTAFWLSAVTGLVLSVALLGASPLLASLLGVPAAAAPLRGLSVSVFATVLGSVPVALMRRRLSFRLIALQGTAAALLGQVVAIVIALRGGGVWALVAQLVASQTTITVLAWWSSRWWPSREFDRAGLPAMLRFGASVVSVEFVATARAAAETAVVALALGAPALGYLNVAQRLVQVVQDLGAAAVVPVSTVVFAKVRDDLPRLRLAYGRALRLSYTAVAPLLVVVSVGAPVLMPLLFGSAWTPSVPVARGLAVAAVLTLGAMVDQGLFYGVAAPGQWFWYALVTDTATVGVTALLAPHGLVAVAWGFVGVALAATIARWFLVGRLVGLPTRHVAGPLATTSALAIVAAGAGWLAMAALGSHHGVGTLAVVGAAVLLTHLMTARVLCPAVLRDALALAPVPRRLLAPLSRIVGSGAAA